MKRKAAEARAAKAARDQENGAATKKK
jgi:hypothetical protein